MSGAGTGEGTGTAPAMAPSVRRHAGKVALVTGAASGIGRAVALRLGQEGAAVACIDLAEAAAADTAASVRGAGGSARSYRCDVSSPAEVDSTVRAAAAELGRPEVLCNVAGIGSFAHSDRLDIAEWSRIIEVNLTGTFLMCRAALPHLLDGGGVIINTSSTAGSTAQPYSAAYCASKGGVNLLTKALAWEFLKRGVRVNAVAPGGIETPIMEGFLPPADADAELLNRLISPLGFGQPEDVAGLFAYLASDDARYVTGAVMTIDGGMTC